MSFWGICVASIVIFSVLAYATVYGKNLSDEADFAFIQGEGEVLKDVVAPWFGTFFWIFGSISLVLVALGVVDYVARLASDVLKTLHLRDNERWSESKLYASIVWTMALLGCAVLLSGFDQPLVLLVLSACLNGIVMFIYSILLIKLNRTGLPPAIRVSRPPARHARLRGAVLRLLRRLVRDRPARGDRLVLARRLFARFVVFAVAFTVLYVAASLLGLLTV